jgi:diguanylate cyclase (GGDEF)-like protein
MGGFSDVLRQDLQHRLGAAEVHSVERGEDLIQSLSGGEFSLLVLDHGLENPPAIEILEQVRSDGRWKELPVIYCLNEGSGVELVKRLAREFKVQDVMLPPLDADELAWKAARLLGISRAQELQQPHDGIGAAVAGVRTRFMDVVSDRVGVLEQAGTALLEQKLSRELRASAGREAHKLAGLLGTIGFPAGSRYAREIDELLDSNMLLTEKQALRVSELVVALRLELGKEPLSTTVDRETTADQFSLLIADNDQDLVEKIEAEAAARDWRVETAADFASTRKALSDNAPDAVLLNPHLSGDSAEGLALVGEISSRSPSIPVIVLTSRDNFTDRVEVARRGARGFLSKTSTSSQIVEAAWQLASRFRAEASRILAVDDDARILDFLRALLEPRGIRVATLADPLRFWDQLELFAPDLLLLDVDMPYLSGIELCRVVRNDPRWAHTPILFLTGHTDPQTVDRVFSAGADDFVPKPIVGPELLTRVFNRLEQSRLRRSIEETDSLTGVLNRARFCRAFIDLLELSRRQGQPLAFALIELESLKRINSTYSHAAGDAVLQQFGGILREAFRSADAVGRWTGCVFAAGMYGLSRYNGVQRLNELSKTVQRERFKERDGKDIPVQFSAAVAEYGEDGNDFQELYRAAETALLQAQKTGGRRVVPAGWIGRGREPVERIDVALLIEDDAQASLLTYLLDERGCRTRRFRDSKSAARLMTGSRRAIQPKVVFVDVDLPGVDGLSLLKAVAASDSPPRAVVLTSPSFPNSAQTALELGAFDCVVKPFNPAIVAQRICRALDAR